MKKGFITIPILIFTLLILPALLFASQYRVLRAAELLPNDQQAHYGYALCLNQTGEQEEPDSIFRKAIDISPYSEISKMCRAAKTKIAQHTI